MPEIFCSRTGILRYFDQNFCKINFFTKAPNFTNLANRACSFFSTYAYLFSRDFQISEKLYFYRPYTPLLILNPISDPKYNVISVNVSMHRDTYATSNVFFTGWSLAEYSYEKTELKLCNKKQENAIIWLTHQKLGYNSYLSSDNHNSSSNHSAGWEEAYRVRNVNELLSSFICIK